MEADMQTKRSRVRRAVKHQVKRTFVTLGDLINAACDVAGSTEAAAVLLTLSPLSRLTDRRIVLTA
jgi:hypothetical protein